MWLVYSTCTRAPTFPSLCQERQRAWDEVNVAEVAAAKKKRDQDAHRMALQVSCR
jgi:hypothetical protein